MAGQPVSINSAGIINESEFPPDGATAAYDFESGSGSTLVDRTGNGNDGSVTGMSWTTSTQYGDYAGSFDGTDDYVNCGTVFPSSNSQIYEIEAQIYPTSGGERWVASEEGRIAVIFDRSGSQNITLATWGDAFTHSQTLSLDQWHDIYVLFDGSNKHLIEVNGKRESATTDDGVDSRDNDFGIGKRLSSSSEFAGAIDNVAAAHGNSAVLR